MREPAQLLARRRDEITSLADELEAEIDREMDRSYEGGEFVFPHGGDCPPPLVEEIRRRYARWLVRLDQPEIDGRNEYYGGALVFAPLDPGGDVKDFVLSILRASAGPVEMEYLQDQCKYAGLTKDVFDVGDAVWALISEKKAAFTPGRDVVAVPAAKRGKRWGLPC